KQHEHRPGKCVKEEFESCIDAPRMSPYAYNEEHGDKLAFKEKIKEDEIEGAKDAGHQGLENKEGDHIFLDAILNRLPRRENANRHQECGQKDEGKRNPVNAHFVDETLSKPALLLDKLKGRGGWVKLRINVKREQKDNDCGAERRVAGVIQCGLVIAAKGENEGCPNKRQENDACQNAEAEHQRTPRAIYQLMTRARPMTMAAA